MTGCSNEQETSQKETDYIVVKLPEDCEVADIFQIKSVLRNSLNGAEKMGVSNGVYCIGTLENGDTVVWRSDDDVYGYDDSLMVYVKGEVSDKDILYWARRLNETPVSYEEFEEEYIK